MKALTNDERFFYDNAGYATPPGRRACAVALAKAEREARQAGITFAWEWDADADHSWCGVKGEHAHEVLGCIARDPSGVVLASLWGIFDPSKVYGRVVEAELAQEALTSLGEYAGTFPK